MLHNTLQTYSRYACAVIACVFCCVGVFFITPHVTAQFSEQRVDPLALAVTPQFAAPNTLATISLTSFGTDMHDAAIDWKVNGAMATSSTNARSITIPTGDGTKPLTVEARVRIGTESPRTLTRTIAPSAVDIIVEPQTSVPLWYPGSARASHGNAVRLVAVPHLFENGKRLPTKDISFTWLLNNETLMGGSQVGTNITTITMPRYGRTDVTVIAESRDGTRVARTTTTIQPEQPRIAFYESSSLYGTIPLSPDRFVTDDEEITIRAVPYYMNEAHTNGARLVYVWSVDGTPRVPTSEPHSLTVERAKGRATRTIDLTFTSELFDLVMGAGSFEAQFIEPNSLLTP